MAEEKITFEQKLQKLEKISKALGDTKTELEQSVALFEEGMALAKELDKQLSKIERRIEIVTSDGDSSSVVTEPYN